MHAHCASGCCGSHAAWPCPCPVGGSERLPDAASLVSCYLQTQGGLAAEQAYYQSLASPSAALRDALQSLADDEGLRPGQIPLKSTVAKQLITALEPLADSLATCSDFTNLHAQLLQAGRPYGLEPTAAYDTALRLGMQTGLLPRCVYIHAGNGASLHALGVEAPASGWLAPNNLPDVIRSMAPHEIERCLSLCRNQWQRLSMKS